MITLLQDVEEDAIINAKLHTLLSLHKFRNISGVGTSLKM